MRWITLLLAVAFFGTAKSVGTDLKVYGGDSRAPPLKLPALDGAMISLANYRGKVVLLNFWASWCEPCLQELPSLERLSDALSGRSFAVVTVNIGEHPDMVRTWLERLDVHLTVLMDVDGKATRAWRVFAFPSSFIVDRDGNISHANYGALEWDQEPTFTLIETLVGER